MPKKNNSKKLAVPLDFMPDWADELHREPEQMSVEQMKSALMNIFKPKDKSVSKTKTNSSKTTRK